MITLLETWICWAYDVQHRGQTIVGASCFLCSLTVYARSDTLVGSDAVLIPFLVKAERAALLGLRDRGCTHEVQSVDRCVLRRVECVSIPDLAPEVTQ